MTKFCFFVAALHFSLFLISIPIANLNEGWNSILVWGIWCLIDAPISLLYFVLSNPISSLVDTSHPLGYVLYPPYFIHGLLGTIWWFFLPRIYYRVKRNRK